MELRSREGSLEGEQSSRKRSDSTLDCLRKSGSWGSQNYAFTLREKSLSSLQGIHFRGLAGWVVSEDRQDQRRLGAEGSLGMYELQGMLANVLH